MDKLRSLIIEDDAELGDAFQEIFEYSGLQTELVRDGDKALEALSKGRLDLVILDLHLPKVSGPEILEYIQHEERLGGARVVIVTADTRLAEVLKGSADLVLVKPVGFADLMGIVEHFFP